MVKTIKNLLHILARATADYISAQKTQEYEERHRHGVSVMPPAPAWDSAFDRFGEAQDAIVDPWNTAIDAMEAVVYLYISYHDDGYWYCSCCRCGRVIGHSSTCYAGKCEAALEMMRGETR